ncbi:hypothetical protein JNUCC1_00799 [Lentibacillus sp. JNUCC-1]|nr:hypothetical protein [Lentibacillus sp. JNUCC-1]
MMSLPYHHARFSTDHGGGRLAYNMNHPEAQFSVDVRHASEMFTPDAGTLEHWLTERYHFYSIKGERIFKATIAHTSWSLHEARVESINTNIGSFIPQRSSALAHAGASQTTYLYPFEVKGKYVK